MLSNQKLSNSFIPLQTVQGIDLHTFCNNLNDRVLIFWGAGHLGKILQRAFEKIGYHNTAFCDSNTFLHNNVVNGKSVFSPQVAIGLAKTKNAVLIVSNAQNLSSIKNECLRAGLKDSDDFYTYLRLTRQEAVIEISNSLTDHRMAFFDYRSVLDKLLNDIPNLLHIDLNGNGDPLLNPELPRIINYTVPKISCTVTTRMPENCNLQAVLDSKPSQFVFLISDIEFSQSNAHNDLNWESINERLFQISIQREINSDVEFRISLQRNRNINDYQVSKLQDLCDSFALKLVISNSYPNSYQSFLDYCCNDNSKRSNDLDNLDWDLSLALNLAVKDQNLPCLCQRIFPVIDSNKRVNICHLYPDTILSNEFLSTNYFELLNQRSDNQHCRKCQSHSLHRLDIDVLQKRNNIQLGLHG